MDCIVHGVAKSLTQLNHFHFQHDPIQRSKPWKLQWMEVGGPPSPQSRKCRQKCQRIGSWTDGDAIPALMWMVHADDFQFVPLTLVSWFSHLWKWNGSKNLNDALSTNGGYHYDEASFCVGGFSRCLFFFFFNWLCWVFVISCQILPLGEQIL